MQLRIGYLRTDPDAQLNPSIFRALEQHLAAKTNLLGALRSAGRDGIALLAADTHEGLVQRMGRNEFDVVFCSALDYVSQTGNYEAVFQLRRPGDAFDPRGGRVFHRGAVFVNNRSPMFASTPSPDELAQYLRNAEMAVVSTYSAAGYVYPYLKIAEMTSNTLPSRQVFANSSEEVVKYVINGVTEIGACDANVIDEVLRRHQLFDHKDKLVRVLFQTDPIPTDPVVMAAQWAEPESEAGRLLRDAVREFFAANRQHLPALEPSSSEKFRDLRENLARFHQLLGNE